MATKKTARKKVTGGKKTAKPGKKNLKVAKKAPAKKTVMQKKSLKQKAKPKLSPKKKVAAVSRKVSSKTKKVLKKTPAKNVKKPAKAIKKTATKATVGNSKKPKETPIAAPQIQKPLDPVFVKIRQGLLASRAELFKIVVSSQELERNVSELTFSNEIDLASSLEGREMVFQLASRDRNGLKLIDDALFKMAHGTYGVCEACSKPIGIKRLQILPLTQFCIECQESMEHAS